ncbi:MAG: zf-HC2 domain-containing protein [Rhodococcus sp. (in: high G+C Gram-positive bacteria)]
MGNSDPIDRGGELFHRPARRDCPLAREALSARIDGEREPVPTHRTDEHLATCTDCRLGTPPRRHCRVLCASARLPALRI